MESPEAQAGKRAGSLSLRRSGAHSGVSGATFPWALGAPGPPKRHADLCAFWEGMVTAFCCLEMWLGRGCEGCLWASCTALWSQC